MKHLLLSLTLIISANAWAKNKEVYLECESNGNYRDSTEWINNSCQITKKSKHYYEIKDDYWKVIHRKTNGGGEYYKKPDGNAQHCGEKVEPFQTILKRTKTTGKAFDYEWYEGSNKVSFL